MVGVEGRRGRGVIRVGVVIPHDLEPGGPDLGLEPPEVVGRDEVAVGIVGPPVDGRPQPRDLLAASFHAADQRAAALGRIGRLAVAPDLLRERLGQAQAHGSSQRWGSLR